MYDKLIMQEVCRKRFLPVVEEINRLLEETSNLILVAIDGNSASGKTTLGYYLAQVFECNLYHMDDFFLQNEQRTEERQKEVGGNVDYERFRQEVIEPIVKGEHVIYRPFSCKNRCIQDGTEVAFKRLNIIEGSYSQHPYFGDVYQLRVFMEIPEEQQRERIRLRNGEGMLERFITEWIPKENSYFEKYNIRKKSMVIKNSTT